MANQMEMNLGCYLVKYLENQMENQMDLRMAFLHSAWHWANQMGLQKVWHWGFPMGLLTVIRLGLPMDCLMGMPTEFLQTAKLRGRMKVIHSDCQMVTPKDYARRLMVKRWGNLTVFLPMAKQMDCLMDSHWDFQTVIKKGSQMEILTVTPKGLMMDCRSVLRLGFRMATRRVIKVRTLQQHHRTLHQHHRIYSDSMEMLMDLYSVFPPMDWRLVNLKVSLQMERQMVCPLREMQTANQTDLKMDLKMEFPHLAKLMVNYLGLMTDWQMAYLQTVKQKANLKPRTVKRMDYQRGYRSDSKMV